MGETKGEGDWSGNYYSNKTPKVSKDRLKTSKHLTERMEQRE